VLELRIDGKPIDLGTMVPLGTEIDLIIGDGLGNRVFKMPNFLGLQLEEADFTIVGSGLNLGSIEVRVLNPSDVTIILDKVREMDVEIDTAAIISSGHVYKQHPVAGEEVRLGEQVDLWIVSFSKEDSMLIMDNWQKRKEESDDLSEDIN
jgi:beta-lactam-binding protein with PASTA domain